MFKFLISKPIKRKQYKPLAECIVSDQVSSDSISWYFEDTKFKQWYIKNKNKLLVLQESIK